MYKCKCFEAGREPAMRIFHGTTPGMRRLARNPTTEELSRNGKQRLQMVIWYYAHKENASLTARHYGVSRPTVAKWVSRYNPKRLRSLEDLPSKPKKIRRPEWTTEAVVAVRELREEFPRWGKKKLTVLLEKAGWALSQSTVGRILSHLRKTGQLHYFCKKVEMRWKKSKRPWATRKPNDYGAKLPGDILQIDTVDLRPLPGVIYKQLSAVDVVSRWSTLQVKSRATARVTRDSIKAMLARIPFPVKALQIDGGSEFMAEFEEYCEKEKLRLFVLPPHSPKLNGRVERFNRTSREEFHEVSQVDATVIALQGAAQEWEVVYNTIRPHEALGLKTPLEFLNNQGLYPEVAA